MDSFSRWIFVVSAQPYLDGGMKRGVAARGAGEVRMDPGNEKTAQLLILTLHIDTRFV